MSVVLSWRSSVTSATPIPYISTICPATTPESVRTAIRLARRAVLSRKAHVCQSKGTCVSIDNRAPDASVKRAGREIARSREKERERASDKERQRAATPLTPRLVSAETRALVCLVEHFAASALIA
eukprot:2368738-Rhodomonas_salina.2